MPNNATNILQVYIAAFQQQLKVCTQASLDKTPMYYQTPTHISIEIFKPSPL